jgi:hypothetical protein
LWWLDFKIFCGKLSQLVNHHVWWRDGLISFLWSYAICYHPKKCSKALFGEFLSIDNVIFMFKFWFYTLVFTLCKLCVYIILFIYHIAIMIPKSTLFVTHYRLEKQRETVGNEISNNKKKENDWIEEIPNIWRSQMCRYQWWLIIWINHFFGQKKIM